MGFSKLLGDIAKGTVNNLLGGSPNSVGDSKDARKTGGTIHDWNHAYKVFAGADMLRMPKHKGMFHVSFVFNPDVFTSGGATGLQTTVPRDVLSVLTKSVELPKFTMDYSTLNQYNHTSYNYKKIKFDPITITFHDDMADIVTTFWYFYYAYYFAEGNKSYERGGGGAARPGKDGSGGLFAGLINKGISSIKKSIAGLKDKLAEGIGKKLGFKGGNAAAQKEADEAAKAQAADAYEAFRKYADGIMYDVKESKNISGLHYAWGLNGSAYHVNGAASGKNIPMLQAIEIYPLGNKKASMIVLHNPKIVSWAHDTFEYGAEGTATCQAQFVYEGVTYKDQIDAKTILDDVSMYDRHGAPSKGGGKGLFSFIEKVDGILGKAYRGEQLTGGDIITGLSATKSLFKKG